MFKSIQKRFPFIVLLGLVVFVSFGVSRPPSHAASQSPGSGASPTVHTPPQALSQDLADASLMPTNCRYGVTFASSKHPVDWLPYFGVGHFINFLPVHKGPEAADNVELLPQVRVSQDKLNGRYLPSYSVFPPLTMENDGLGPIILNNQGATWIVGNEPEVSNKDQDNINPKWYARAYHEIYHFIKNVDPTAQIAIAGVSEITPGRLQYLDIVWDTYLKEFGEPMPVDVWNVHLYILAEIRPWDGGHADGMIALGTDRALAIEAAGGDYENRCPLDNVYCRAEHDDIDIFMDQIIALRTWMKEHDQQNKPLILTEFSTLFPFFHYNDPYNPTDCDLRDEFGECFTRPRVTTFLHKTVDFLDSAKDPDLGYPADGYRLVQQWTWYPAWTSDISGLSSILLEDNYESHQPGSEEVMTMMGRAYRDRAKNSERTVNLVAGETPTVIAKANNGTADLKLKAGLFNNGSTAVTDSFKVTFYKDQALTQVIGETTVNPNTSGVIKGCSWDHETDWASVTWNDAPTGVHTFWVKIDSNDQITGETNDADNVTTGTAIVSNKDVYSLDIEIVSEGGGQQGGLVSKDPDQPLYIDGQTVSLTATPSTGWRFSGWTGSINHQEPETNLLMNADKIVRANFERIQYKVNVAVNGQGSIDITPEKESYIYGDKVTINAIPSSGWRFESWDGDITTNQPLLNLIIKKDEDLTANFVEFLPEVDTEIFLPIHASP